MSFKMARGIFIVFEGLDRSGKSTQSKKLSEYLTEKGYSVRLQCYPDRSEPTTGPKIDEFLKNAKDVKQDAFWIHNLFAENRKVLDSELRAELTTGKVIIADRYSFSGVSYSAAKEIPELSLQKACESEVGLLKPDLVIFLNANASVTSQRDGFGGEALEKTDFQAKVHRNIQKIFNPTFWKEVDACRSIEEVFEDVVKTVDQVVNNSLDSSQLSSFQLADFNVRNAQEA